MIRRIGLAASAVLVLAVVAWWPDDDHSAIATADEPTTTTTHVPTSGPTTDAAASTATAAPSGSATTRATTSTSPPAAAAVAAPTTTSATTVATTSTAPSTTTTEPAPPYRTSTESVTAADLGSSYTPGRGCAEPGDLRQVTVRHWGYDGQVHDGRVVVAATEAVRVADVFGDLYANRFPIQRMVPVDAYGGDDQASMRANNTSAYNCRTVAGTSKLSNHAFGLAVDVNPLHNPYVKGNSVDPPEGRPWADRSRRDPGMIHAGDATVQAFAARGWKWGGYWSSGQDYQHFSTSGT